MTVNVMSTLTYDIAVLYLQKLLSFIYEMRQETLRKTSKISKNLLRLDSQLIPFSVSDILRAKCSCTLLEMAQVMKNINCNSDINVLRIKNRLGTGNRDFLINFTFKECKLICEVQVGIKDQGEDKSTFQDHFNHFLYELRRAKFGCLSESAIIIANHIDIGTYFLK
jgi:hypothetical protein